jgi:hypothetical protein
MGMWATFRHTNHLVPCKSSQLIALFRKPAWNGTAGREIASGISPTLDPPQSAFRYDRA